MSNTLKLLLFFLSLGIFSCNLEENYVQIDDPEQLKLDSLAQVDKDASLIKDFIDSVGLENVVTISNGIKYSLTSVGNGVFPENNNMLSINITGYYLNDTILSIFDTNIKSVAESYEIYLVTNEYAPITFTYTSDGRYFGLTLSFLL